MTARSRAERARIAGLVEAYRKDGFDVVVAPGPGELPDVLQGQDIDLVARKGEDSVAVAVRTRRGLTTDVRITQLATRIDALSGWRLRLVLAEDDQAEGQIAGPETLARWLSQSRILIASGATDVALLTVWSAVEATLRHLLTTAEQSHGAADTVGLVRRAYSYGEIDEEECAFLVDLGRLRNAVAHGFEVDVIQPEQIARAATFVERHGAAAA